MGQNLKIDENLHGYDNESESIDVVQIEFSCHQESGIIFPPHWHEELVLMYIKTGTLLLECDGEKRVVQPDCIAIVNPNEIHSAEAPEPNLEYYVLKINLMQLLGTQTTQNQSIYTEQLLKKQIQFENIIEADDTLFGYVKNIIQEYQVKEEGYFLAIRGAAYQIFIILMRKYMKTISRKSAIEFQYRRLEQIKPAIIFMENHITEKITLQDLSEVTHLSIIQFSRVFKVVAGLTPMDYLNQLRVQKAVKLLISTNKTIIEVAMDVGFADSNYFSRIFKKYRAVTPREFREKYINRIN